MRRYVCLFASIIIITLLATVFSPASDANPYAAPDVSVTIDDLPLVFEVPLQREEYRVLVPFRAISEAIGVTVAWVDAEKGIIATRPASADRPATEVRLWIDRPTAMVDGQEQALDAQPRLVNDKTFIPARFFATAFGCGVGWDEANQRVLITTGERTMTIYAFYAGGAGETSSWTELFGMPYPDVDPSTANQRFLSRVGYGWCSVDANGRLRDNVSGWTRPGGWENALVESRRAGLTDDLVVHADGKEIQIASILGKTQVLAELRAAIVAEADEFGGVNLDWESFTTGLDAAEKATVRAKYADFVKALATELHGQGKTLTVTVQQGNGAYAAGFDYAALGAAADRLVLMAYDYYDRTLPSPMAPLGKVEEAIRLLLVQQVPAEKILLGVAPGGVEWRTQPTPRAADALGESAVAARKALYTTTWDATVQANWLTFQDAAGSTFRVWIEDGQSISRKIALTKRYGLRGIALWRLGTVPNDVWETIDAATKPERSLFEVTLPPETTQP